MDSKLIRSNIAVFSRYEIVHNTLLLFYKSLEESRIQRVNITETNSETTLNLITSVEVDKANVPDTSFVKSALESTQELTGQPIEKVYADGAYQQPMK